IVHRVVLLDQRLELIPLCVDLRLDLSRRRGRGDGCRGQNEANRGKRHDDQDPEGTGTSRPRGMLSHWRIAPLPWPPTGLADGFGLGSRPTARERGFTPVHGGSPVRENDSADALGATLGGGPTSVRAGIDANYRLPQMASSTGSKRETTSFR